MVVTLKGWHVHCKVRGARQLMRDGRESTARGIVHESQPCQPHQGLRLRQHTRRVRFEVAAQPEFLARQHDRRAVVADRTADYDAIAGTHKIRCKASAARLETDARRRKVNPVAVAAADDFRIAGDYVYAAFARHIRQGVDYAAQQRDLQALFEKTLSVMKRGTAPLTAMRVAKLRRARHCRGWSRHGPIGS